MNPQLFNPSLYQPRCRVKDISFFTPETSTRFFLPKGGYIELKSPHESYLEWVFSRSQEKNFLKIEPQKLSFLNWVEYDNSSFVGLVIGEQKHWLYSQNEGPRQIFWEIFQLISSAAFSREQVNVKKSKNQLKYVRKYIQESIKRCPRTNPTSVSGTRRPNPRQTKSTQRRGVK